MVRKISLVFEEDENGEVGLTILNDQPVGPGEETTEIHNVVAACLGALSLGPAEDLEWPEQSHDPDPSNSLH